MRVMAGAILLLSIVGTCGCTGGRTVFAYQVATQGNPGQGRQAILHYGCGSCHAIPGIHDARGLVGPPLILMGRRTYIGGELPNSPENMVKWLLDPKAVEPGTAMPKLGLSEQEARDVTAYLYSLQSWSWQGGAQQ